MWFWAPLLHRHFVVQAWKLHQCRSPNLPLSSSALMAGWDVKREQSQCQRLCVCLLRSLPIEKWLLRIWKVPRLTSWNFHLISAVIMQVSSIMLFPLGILCLFIFTTNRCIHCKIHKDSLFLWQTGFELLLPSTSTRCLLPACLPEGEPDGGFLVATGLRAHSLPAVVFESTSERLLKSFVC